MMYRRSIEMVEAAAKGEPVKDVALRYGVQPGQLYAHAFATACQLSYVGAPLARKDEEDMSSYRLTYLRRHYKELRPFFRKALRRCKH